MAAALVALEALVLVVLAVAGVVVIAGLLHPATTQVLERDAA